MHSVFVLDEDQIMSLSYSGTYTGKNSFFGRVYLLGILFS